MNGQVLCLLDNFTIPRPLFTPTCSANYSTLVQVCLFAAYNAIRWSCIRMTFPAIWLEASSFQALEVNLVLPDVFCNRHMKLVHTSAWLITVLPAMQSLFTHLGWDYQVKAGQGSSEDFGEESEAQTCWQGERKAQGEGRPVHGYIMRATGEWR